MDFRRKIISDPDIMLGRPVIKGTRITFEHVLKKLAEGFSAEKNIESHPHLKKMILWPAFLILPK